MHSALLVALAILLAASNARAADQPPMVRARVAYNAADYDLAIAAAAEAGLEAGIADVASLVLSRALLERYRQGANPSDLATAREVLRGVDRGHLESRDRVDLLIGLGQALYLDDAFGAAAEIFEPVLTGPTLLSQAERARLLDWWAGALDREAHTHPADRRAPIYERIVRLMEQEVRQNPGSPSGNYWLAAALRGSGDLDRAWDAAAAGWVRVTVGADVDETRAHLNRLVIEVLVPERTRLRPSPDEASAALRAEWETLTSQWP
jgi:hypothetical protein